MMEGNLQIVRVRSPMTGRRSDEHGFEKIDLRHIILPSA